MDAASASGGDSGFDAALRALDELQSELPKKADGIGVTPASFAISIDDGLDPLEAMAAATLAEMAADTAASASNIAVMDDLEAALNASMAEISFTQPAFEPAPAPAPAPQAAPPAVVPVAPIAEVLPPRLRFLPIVAVVLGVFSSLLSMIGLIVASRTIAGASLIVADARERQQQMTEVGKLVRDLDVIRARQLELLRRQQAAASTSVATRDDLHNAMDGIRNDMAKRGPDIEILKMVHEGNAQLAEGLAAIGMKVTRIEGTLSAQRSMLPPRRQ
ncbi:hypothetical protein SAMN05444678_11316 [Sphingomonas sp. YR710]|uniref:hypothetical protein n=1 Tax=Sphingomonas sp. YR710 TaxID=1882773 RepID=UPI00088FFC67|nr:hypothetical protein [Sphingomonas sp. YR710]SDD41373.1 hypothetical protein SAMN05444678_11316 [Sphingomonas sp. YR710]